jgi:hypothetical protein
MVLTLHLIETIAVLVPGFQTLGLAAATFCSLGDMAIALRLLEMREPNLALMSLALGYLTAVALNIEGVIDTGAFRFCPICLVWDRTGEPRHRDRPGQKTESSNGVGQ